MYLYMERFTLLRFVSLVAGMELASVSFRAWHGAQWAVHRCPWLTFGAECGWSPFAARGSPSLEMAWGQHITIWLVTNFVCRKIWAITNLDLDHYACGKTDVWSLRDCHIVITAVPPVPTANQVLFTTTPSTLEMLGETWDLGAKELRTLFHRFSRGSVLFMLMFHCLFVSMVEKWDSKSFHEIHEIHTPQEIPLQNGDP